MTQIIFSFIFFIILAILATTKPRSAIVGVLIYLVFLGFIRRVISYYAGPVNFDPLLLVGPLTTLLIFILPNKTSENHPRTTISTLILILMGIMCLEIFNPTQGGIMAGLSGAIYTIIPLIWFWIGRKYGNEEFLEKILFKVVVPLGIIAAIYGLWQTFYGFTPFEKAWVNLESYNALSVGGTTRAFSFLTSASEYILLIGTTIAIIASGLQFQFKKLVWLVPLLILALFLASGRGVIIILIFTLALIWASKKQMTNYWGRFIFILSLISVVTFFALVPLSQTTFSSSVDGLIKHQVTGLKNPFDPNKSTLPTHYNLMASSIEKSINKPFGYGLSATNLGNKFSNQESQNSEVDFSNIFIVSGPLGGILYLIIMTLILIKTFKLLFKKRTIITLAAVGILSISLANWLTGGHYAMVAIVWFTIGCLDRISIGDNTNKTKAEFKLI